MGMHRFGCAVILCLLLVPTIGQPQTPNEKRNAHSSAKRGKLPEATLKAPGPKEIQSNGFSYSIGPVPSWVKPVDSPESAPGGGGPSRSLLIDTQVNLTGQAPVNFFRGRFVPLDRPGIEEVSQIPILFNPAYESLTVHELGVTRNGKRIDRLANAKIQLLQRESRLEQQVYDGLVTAFVLVDDVRVNDVIDIAYSVTGANPVFNGKFSGDFPLGFGSPTDVRHVRVVYPAQRKMRTKVHKSGIEPVLSVEGGNRVIEVTSKNLSPVQIEEGAPAWYRFTPWLQVSEYESWKEVEDWAKEHYSMPTDLSPELSSLVAGMQEAGKSQQELVSRALAFVQDEIRYFGVETGISSHRPTHPNLTFSRRYGDCKDKTILLIAMLGRMGIAAQPALVSAFRTRQVEDWLPTPLAFDHVITKVVLGDRTYWLDATRSFQGRDLDTLGATPFERALVVGADAGALSEVVLSENSRGSQTISEKFAISSYKSPVQLTVVSSYTGSPAEVMRAFSATKGPEVLSSMLADDMRRRYPKIKALRPPELSDDREHNVLTVNEFYEVPDFFTYKKGRMSFRLDATAIGSYLQYPRTIKRAAPLKLSRQTTVTHRFEIALPNANKAQTMPPFEISSPQFSYTIRGGMTERSMSLVYQLRMLRDQVSPEEMSGFVESANKVRAALARQLSLPVFDTEKLGQAFAVAVRREERPLFGSAPQGWLREFRIRSLAERMVSEAAIGSGQLPSAALSEAYVDLAIIKSQSGEADDALLDIERALKENPDYSRAKRIRADIYAYSGRFDAALLELESIPASAADRDDGDYTYGQVLYYLGRYNEALDKLEQDARRKSGTERIYRLLWLYMAAKHSGMDADQAVRKAGYEEFESEWPGPVMKYLLGKLNQDDLLSAARQNKKEEAPQLCEAWYFIGQKRLIEGDAGEARKAFENSVATKVQPYIEYKYSEVELSRNK